MTEFSYQPLLEGLRASVKNQFEFLGSDYQQQLWILVLYIEYTRNNEFHPMEVSLECESWFIVKSTEPFILKSFDGDLAIAAH
jgi:hypothetical protein